MTAALAEVDGAVTVRVRLTPSGGADRLEGLKADASGAAHLAARVRAAPEDGKANAALEALLAKAVGTPKGAVAVVRGQTARLKTLRIEGVELATVQARLGIVSGDTT